MEIKTIAEELKIGQVEPGRLAEMSDWLAGTSSSLMDRQLELQVLYAEYFDVQREFHDSDKATDNAWKRNKAGLEQLQLETTQKKIKVLLQTIGRHLKVAHDQAYNRI
jgi:hypothetical protein